MEILTPADIIGAQAKIIEEINSIFQVRGVPLIGQLEHFLSVLFFAMSHKLRA